ncbi:MAG: ATPase [Clostridia bacterium]|nr:ATPase [Clostridia bacterium]
MYVCGWDGGGTKTAIRCENAERREILHCQLGPLTMSGAGLQDMRQVVASAVTEMSRLPEGLDGCRMLVIGTAGVSNTKSVSQIEKALRDAGYRGPSQIVGDQVIALEAAISGPGAILSVGTGSICVGRDLSGQMARCGGYGYLIDDEGGGYALGRDILAAVVRAEDGRGEPTKLRDFLFEHLGVQSIQGMITWLYGEETKKKDIAALAPLLLPALHTGDHAALEIAEKAAVELTQLVTGVFRKLELFEGELALMGSIMEHVDIIRNLTEEKCLKTIPGISVTRPRHSAVEGAVMLAWKSLMEQTA